MEETQFVADNYTHIPTREIAQKLGRKPQNIVNKANRLGLNNDSRRWSQDEIVYLTENYGKTPTREIAQKLGKTMRTVQMKIYNIRRKVKFISVKKARAKKAVQVKKEVQVKQKITFSMPEELLNIRLYR
jgi:DNA-binding CsgD family transcriptional regulator